MICHCCPHFLGLFGKQSICQNMSVSNTMIKLTVKSESIFLKLITKRNAQESAETGLAFTIFKKSFRKYLAKVHALGKLKK